MKSKLKGGWREQFFLWPPSLIQILGVFTFLWALMILGVIR